MSFARRQERILAMKAASAPASGGGHTRHAAADQTVAAPAFTPAGNTPAARAAATIATRLRHDKQRLKQLKSVDRKVAAKRLMLSEYDAWCQGLLDAGRQAEGRELPSIGADDVLPTVMVWRIDTGDYAGALALARFMLRFNVTMPAHYKRDAATLVLEEIAGAALKAQGLGQSFDLDVLEAVEELTADVDMHDEPRAKLFKALGAEQLRAAGMSTGDAVLPTIDRAIATLSRAQELHDRVGVKTMLRGLDKARAAAIKLSEGAEPPAETTAGTPAG